MSSNEICFKSATELTSLLKNKELSAVELMSAHLDQIDRINPQVNAIVTQLSRDESMALAEEADAKLARGDELGPLHGLPVAHKDLAETKGMRTTMGSPMFKDWIPDRSALIVQRMQAGGALTIGKTNVPEFGAGSHTFNPVFGATLNPYDLTKTCGGSSGGAGVALATGMIPIADGSDMGGSLRNPAGYNNVVGFRPSPGLVPSWPSMNGWATMGVVGPMARTVEDIALQLQAMVGRHRYSPIAQNVAGSHFAQPLARDFKGSKVAWSQNLNSFPVDPAVTAVLESQRHVFTDLGCHVEENQPEFGNADAMFKALRAFSFEVAMGDAIEKDPSMFKETIQWNVQLGRTQTGQDLSRLERERTMLFEQVADFMDEYDYLVLPVSQVPPFPIETEYPTEINGVQMESYIDWMQSCYFITVTGLPCISVPCGFTDDGLPTGIQIVGKHQDDLGVLQMAYAFQEATQVWKKRPGITG